MSVLSKQEAEIPLNGGQDDQAGAEYQAVTTLRAVTDLRMNNGGEWEKRPATASTQAIVNPGSVGVYAGLGGAGVVESRGEVYALTDNYGVMNEGGRYIGGGGNIIASGQVPFSYELTPKVCRVSRRYIDRVSGDDSEQGFQSFASCVYDSTTLVTAAVVYVASGSGCMLRLQALDIETGAVLAQMMYANDTAASTSWAVDACANSDATTPGAVITFGSGSGAPYSIRKYRYRAGTQDFVDDGAIVTDAISVRHRIKQSPSAAGRFLIAWEGAGPVLMAKDATCTAFTVITTHAGTHAAAGAYDFVISGTKVLLVSCGLAGGAPVYAEVFGSPAAYISTTPGAGFSPFSLTAARETASGNDDRAVIFFSIYSSTTLGISTRAWSVNFTASPVVSVIVGSTYAENMMVAGHGATVDGRAYAFLVPWYSVAESNTPCLVRAEELIAGTSVVLRPVARVCHDVFAAPFTALASVRIASSSVVGDSIYATILTDLSVDSMPNPTTRVAQSVAMSRVDLTPVPVVAAQRDGVAVVAGGLPFELDGDVPTITQSYCRPVVTLDSSTAGSETAATGIKVIALYRWVDAAGRLHRSAPSASVDSGAFTTQRLDAYVTIPPNAPFTNTLGRKFSVELYATTDGGTTYYLANDASGYQKTAYSVSENLYVFQTVLAGVTTNTQLYSTGAANEELTSDPPPAFQAICTVGDRMWAIDAEDRSRIWPSKPFSAGYAVEWNTANTLFIGDDGVGISDVGGVPTVFCKRGIWQVYGEGPNALGVGSFAPARRLPHEVACLDALSVCKTPVGVVFRSRGGVVMLANDLSLQDIGAPLASLSVSGTPTGYCKIAYDELSDELHVLDFDTVHYVLNMGEGKWSKWTQDSAFQNWADCVCVNGRMWWLQRGSSVTDSLCRLKAVDEASHNSHTYGWSLQTPWIRFDGVTGNMRVYECVPQIRLGSAVADTGTLTVLYETRDSATDTFTFSAADIIALGSAGKTVNLRCPLRYQRTRQFRITMTEGTPGSATAGHVPVGMRVLYGVQPGGERKKTTTQNKGGT